MKFQRRRTGLGTTASVIVLLTLWAGNSLSSSPTVQAASACAGGNGRVAVVKARGGRAGNLIGLVTGNKRVRPLFAQSGIEWKLESPSFSCDGKEIAYSVEAGEPGCDSLEVADVSTGKRRGLDTGHLCASNPAFLSNGTIVFSAQGGTYAVDTNGSRLHHLFDEHQAASATNGRWFVASPWFHTLFLLNAEGRRVRSLAPRLDPHTGEYLRPHFSPDGRWIVYERTTYISNSRQHADLFIVRRNGTHRRRLTTGEKSSQPTFSPDGRWVAFIRGPEAGGGNVYALSVKHPTRIKTLTNVGNGNFYEPTWAPR